MTSSGDAAEEVVRLVINGAEVTLRLTASAAKNMLALSMALSKSHKKLCGKISMKKMLRETRDIRVFPMSRKQFRQFEKRAKKLRLLYASIRDKDGKEKMIDVVLPATELDRANFVFEKMLYQQQDKTSDAAAEKEAVSKEAPSKNVSRSKPDLRDTKSAQSSKTPFTPEEPMMNERSAILRLWAYKRELEASTSEKAAEKVTAKAAETVSKDTGR